MGEQDLDIDYGINFHPNLSSPGWDSDMVRSRLAALPTFNTIDTMQISEEVSRRIDQSRQLHRQQLMMLQGIAEWPIDMEDFRRYLPHPDQARDWLIAAAFLNMTDEMTRQLTLDLGNAEVGQVETFLDVVWRARCRILQTADRAERTAFDGIELGAIA